MTKMTWFIFRVSLDEAFQAQKVLRVFQELQVSKERRVALDYLVFLDEKVLQDEQAPRESKVPETRQFCPVDPSMQF